MIFIHRHSPLSLLTSFRLIVRFLLYLISSLFLLCHCLVRLFFVRGHGRPSFSQEAQNFLRRRGRILCFQQVTDLGIRIEAQIGRFGPFRCIWVFRAAGTFFQFLVVCL